MHSQASIFHTCTPLETSAPRAFEFHSDPRNISLVMPPSFRLIDLKTDFPAQEGGLIELHCRDAWIIPMHWTCRWKTVEFPHLLVDEMLKGPFRLFVHEHRFEETGSKSCLMHDTVRYQWGHSWWGKYISETVIRLVLTMLFKYRHHRTRQWAKKTEEICY